MLSGRANHYTTASLSVDSIVEPLFSVLYAQIINEMFLFDLVPFDEDDKDRSVWFLDHDYLEQMYGMFKKVNGGSLTFESNILAVLCNDA